MEPPSSVRIGTALAGLAITAFTGPAAGNGYLFIEGIEGESTDLGHEDWIDLVEADFGIQRIIGTPISAAGPGDLTVVKELDKATPYILEALAAGTELPSIILDQTGKGGPSTEVPETILKASFEKIRVSSYGTETDANDDVVREVIGFSYARAQWHYQQIAKTGEVTDHVATYWDFDLMAGGDVGEAPEIGQLGNIYLAFGKTREVFVSIQDIDTPLAELELSASSANPELVEVVSIEPAPYGAVIHLSASSYLWGETAVTVTASDEANEASMNFPVFVETGATPYFGFITAYFTPEEQEDPQISSPISDPDRDDLSNLIEFLLGTHPREPTAAPTAVQLEPQPGGQVLTLTYSRRIDDPSVTLTLMGTIDGRAWTLLEPGNPYYGESVEIGDNPAFEEVTGHITPPPEAKGFMIRFVAGMN